MPSMNAGQARVIDPIITEVARGYNHAATLAYPELLPTVPVGQRGGKIIEFGAEEFEEYATGRAPGADMEEVNFGHEGDEYALSQNALAGKVPIEYLEEADAVPGIDLARVAVHKVMKIIDLKIERKAAALATSTANYATGHHTTLSGSSQWSHADSKPAEAVMQKKEVVANKIGIEPNKLILTPQSLNALLTHTDVLDRIKYTQKGIVNLDLLAAYFDVEKVMVARSRGKNSSGQFAPLWGNVAILAYTETGSLASMGTPSFGYTYRLRGYPLAEQPYYNKSKRSWIYPVVTEDTPVIAGNEAAFLFNGVSA